MDGIAKLHRKESEAKEPPRGIDFSVMLTRPDGTPQFETAMPSVQQIAQLANSNDFSSLVAKLRDISQQQNMTLAKACELALDVGLEADKNEGIKPKIKRGNLIDKINKSVENGKELVLTSEDISMLKNRIGSVFQTSYLVRQMCLILDPAVGED